MKKKAGNDYDVLIAGAGFAGSLTALVLQKTGLKVCLLERGQHPRFAIGESSTPVADMILRKLASRYDLPWLYDFSRYGSWQRSHPEIICGIKRGFSFFKHYPGEDFTTDSHHKNELLVAATSSDIESDTNWLRSDFDAFLVTKVKDTGIDYFELIEITEAKKNGKWQFETRHLDETQTIFSSFYIDASGSGVLAQKLFGIHSSADDFLTNSFAVFSHFNHVPHWTEILQERKIPVNDYPYNPDWSALHQIMDEGWMWMLRFNDDRTSVGFALKDQKEGYGHLSAEELWKNLLQQYPGIKEILKNVELHPQPGKIIKSGRLQRKMKRAFGHGWVALPNTIGFVDPLFSSGIAHSLSGIEKLADNFQEFWSNENIFYQNLEEYEKAVFAEIKLTDCLIAGCYQTMPYFELFNTWSMLYFAATIAHEQRRMKNDSAGYFLNADDFRINRMVYDSYEDLLKIISSKNPSKREIKTFTATIKKRIEPFNSADLLNESCKNMYRHTVANI